LPVRELLETLLGPEGRRRLQLRRMTNPDLFRLYDQELVLKIRNTRNLDNDRRLLAKFQEYLGQYPPSPELAKGFLAQYAHRKPRTLARYAATIKSFQKWYGEPMDDFRIRVPRSLPPYTEDSDVAKLRAAIEDKQTHKGTVVRDSLLVDLALTTGMRRSELAVLQVKDIHSDFLIAHGKGNKERVIPLLSAIAMRLHNFIRGMKPGENVFKLKAVSIGNKIRVFALKAGLDAFHTHTMRHKFATDLVEKGADIRSVQELLGHADLSTTQVYLSITDKRIREAVGLLDGSSKQKPAQSAYDPAAEVMPVVYSKE